jgi:hypothetical protein
VAYRIKLREERGAVVLRDGSTFADPVKRVSATEWTVFEHLPTAEDPNLEIEEITVEPEKPKRRRRRNVISVKPEAAEG